MSTNDDIVLDPAKCILLDIALQQFSGKAIRIAQIESVHQNLTVTWGVPDEAQERILVRFDADFTLLDVPPADPGDGLPDNAILARLKCSLVVQYQIPSNTALSDETVAAFAQTTAAKDVTPFIREELSSMSRRLGFGRFTIHRVG